MYPVQQAKARMRKKEYRIRPRFSFCVSKFGLALCPFLRSRGSIASKFVVHFELFNVALVRMNICTFGAYESKGAVGSVVMRLNHYHE